MTVTTLEPVSDLAWTHALIAADPVLAAMVHQIVLRHDMVYVEVIGAHFEARAWRHAVNGRIMPSSHDSLSVRRQQVIGTRCQVLVVEFPAGYPVNLLPLWAGGVS